MQKTYGLLQKAITLISNHQLSDFEQTIETNQSIPIKMRQILTSIKHISLKLIEGLSKFREFLNINESQLIYALCLDDSYPQQYRQCLRQIFALIEDCQQRQSLALEDSLFYKDVIKKISNDEQNQAKEFVSKMQSIAPDKRQIAIKLISQVSDLRTRSSIILQKQKDNDKVLQIEDELRAVQKSYLQSKEHIQKLETEIRKLKVQNNVLKEQEKKQLININRLEEENRKLMDEKKAIQNKLTSLENKLKEQKSQRNRMQQIVKQIENALLEKQSQVDKKSALNDELLIKIEELENRPVSSSSVSPALLKKIPELFQCAEQISLILTSSSLSNFSKESRINWEDSLIVQRSKFTNHLKSKFSLSNQFIDNIQKALGDFTSANIFVSYPTKKGGNFMKDLSSKRSVFLICQAKNGSVIGGFLENGIRVGERNSNSFIFICKKQKQLILRLKRGKEGFIRDQQFLIFGEEELVLSPNSSYVSAYYEESAVVGDQFHYEGSINVREDFLEISEAAPPRNKIALQKYELIQLIRK